jgi:hypothetical protein
MKEKPTTIKSWIGKNVRIKREYIKVELRHPSTYDVDADDEYNFIERVYEYEETYIECDNGLNGVVDNPTDAIFKVKMDIYGIDLFNYRGDGLVVGDVEATHQLIIEVVDGSNKISYPYLWDSKYFEVVIPVRTTTTEWVLETEVS